MRITTLRIIDLWVGRPICWLMTILYFAKRLFIKRQPPTTPKKILFIKLFGAGSLVLAHPTVKAVRQRFPAAEIFFLTFHSNKQVLTLLDLIPPGNIFTVRDDTLPHLLLDLARNLPKMVGKRIDIVIDLEFFSRFTAILSFALRTKQRIGFYGFYTEGLRRGRFINCPVNYNHTLHTAKAFFTLLRPLGISQEQFDGTLPQVPPSENFPQNIRALLAKTIQARAEDITGHWIVINPNASELSRLRRWPKEHFTTLVVNLLQEFPGYRIALVGSPAEKPFVDQLAEKIAQTVSPSLVANLAGRTSISELIDLFHFAALLITNDSGPAHWAALTGIPTITLFGPETPDLYAPLNPNGKFLYLGLDCQPCISIYNGKHSYCTDNQCLKQLQPELVLDLAKEMLAGVINKTTF
ncbi:MAG: glycosyltransferase family 9 protein [Desulfobulbaceae bacterium]|nr:glycosyltransferase family 9 protein [Desulfobulbaceae bacterium]